MGHYNSIHFLWKILNKLCCMGKNVLYLSFGFVSRAKIWQKNVDSLMCRWFQLSSRMIISTQATWTSVFWATMFLNLRPLLQRHWNGIWHAPWPRCAVHLMPDPPTVLSFYQCQLLALQLMDAIWQLIVYTINVQHVLEICTLVACETFGWKNKNGVWMNSWKQWRKL